MGRMQVRPMSVLSGQQVEAAETACLKEMTSVSQARSGVGRLVYLSMSRI